MMIEERKEITKEVVQEFLDLVASNVNKFDVEEMYRAARNPEHKHFGTMITRCILMGELDAYHHLIQNIEYYKEKYQL